MKKRILVIYVLFVFLAMVLYIINIQSIYRDLEENQNIISLSSFEMDDGTVLQYEKKITSGEEGLFKYHTTIDGERLRLLNADISLIVTRPRGNWHKIFWNDDLVGIIGSEGFISNNVWNNAYRFTIETKKIKDMNTLTFETYSNYKIGFGTIPVLLTNETEGTALYNEIKRVHGSFTTIALTTLISIAGIQMLFFALSQKMPLHFSILPLTVILSAVYLLDYATIQYAPLTSLQFKKINFLALYLAMLMMSYTFSILFKKKIWFVFSCLGFSMATFFMLTSKSLVALGNRYVYTNLVILIVLFTWFAIASVRFIRFKDAEDGLLAFATFLIVGTGIMDNFFLLGNNGKAHRLFVLGMTFYSMAILVYTFYHYVEDQKKIYHEKTQLEEEKKRLEKALVTDELTGLPNHRAFHETNLPKVYDAFKGFQVMHIDIDQFRVVNNTVGHAAGDAIIKQMAYSLKNYLKENTRLYRYGGEEFVAVSPFDFHLPENIRKHIIKDDTINQLSSYVPITVSIGVAFYPNDGHSQQSLVLKAEKCTHFAKHLGRNRVCYYQNTLNHDEMAIPEAAIKQSLLSDFVITLAAAIDLKDVYTGKHSEEVTRYSLLIADAVKLSDNDRTSLKMGSLLHDIGKIAIPDSILRKTEKLTNEEYQTIRKHVEFGSKLIEEILDNTDAIACVRNHHERYDGKGYPDQLKGENIPMLARIVCVADAYHAMISSRPYRKGMERSEAIEELKRYSGSQFDPAFVDIMIHLFDEGVL